MTKLRCDRTILRVERRSITKDSSLIVYDADRIVEPDYRLFEPEYWRQQGGLAGAAIGRGSAWFLETPFGSAVLRECLRGGFPARINRDRYFFTGWDKTRPVAEFRILEQLSGEGLPVPEPLAALARRRGMFYTGSLLTRKIAGALPLADLMVEKSERPRLWRRTGRCIRRFHDRGVVHADLNARNILVDLEDRIFLIDFDRARIAPGREDAYQRNMKRLKRSFQKLWPRAIAGRMEPCWQDLMAGYREGGAA